MNKTHVSRPGSRSFWLRWPFLVAFVPLLLFVVLLVGLAVHEKRSSNRLHAELTRIREAGLPIDDASMNQWYAENSSRAGTADWGEILRLVESEAVRAVDLDQLPYIGSAEPPTEIASQKQWREKEAVAEYLRWMRPLIEQIHDAAEHPTPVWQPIQFQGFMTLLPELQESRSVGRLLQLETEDALHRREADRALRGLESLGKLADAFDSRLCMVAELVQIALRGTHQTMIRRSLNLDLWDEDQLQHLSQQVGPPRDIPTRWRTVIAGERAMMLASLDNEHVWYADETPAAVRKWLFALPSTRAGLVKAYRGLGEVGEGGLDDLSPRAKAWEQSWLGKTEDRRSFLLALGRVHELVLPPAEGFANAMVREEDSRRLTQTALAIKSFQLQEQRWPESLRELEQVGLPASEWKTVNAGPFGYEVADDEAYLWQYDVTRNESEISPTRPKIDDENDIRDTVLTIIR